MSLVSFLTVFIILHVNFSVNKKFIIFYNFFKLFFAFLFPLADGYILAYISILCVKKVCPNMFFLKNPLLFSIIIIRIQYE